MKCCLALTKPRLITFCLGQSPLFSQLETELNCGNKFDPLLVVTGCNRMQPDATDAGDASESMIEASIDAP